MSCQWKHLLSNIILNNDKKTLTKYRMCETQKNLKDFATSLFFLKLRNVSKRILEFLLAILVQLINRSLRSFTSESQ